MIFKIINKKEFYIIKMITEKEHNPENSKVFEAFSNDSKKFEILMKKGIE